LDILTFITASFVLAITPGPDNIFVLTQSALYGKKAGILITLGLCTGLVFHTTLVAFGISAIVQSSDWAFDFLKLIGAIYLLYLAYNALSTKASSFKKNSHLSAFSLYKRGILMNTSNPKVSLFFLAFLPQFASPATGSFFTQMYLLGGLFILVTLCAFGGIAYASGAIQQRLENSPQIQALMNKITAGVFILLALNLLI